MAALRLPQMFLEKKQLDFVRLKLWSVHSQKFSKQDKALDAWIGEALQKIRMSSAKKRCVIDGAIRVTFMP